MRIHFIVAVVISSIHNRKKEKKLFSSLCCPSTNDKKMNYERAPNAWIFIYLLFKFLVNPYYRAIIPLKPDDIL